MSHQNSQNQQQSLHIADLYLEIEKAIKNQVKGNYPYRWKENIITEDILKDFRNKFRALDINGLRNHLKIEWEAYKFSGKSESKFGDIAIIVKSAFRDGETTEGVAFLEAKKRDRDSIKFGSIKIPQIRRILKNSPKSMLLLYDYEEITQGNINLERFFGFYHDLDISPSLYTPYTHAAVVQSDLFLATRNKNTKLYRHSLSFAYQLCYRYFLGLDLEYKEKIIDEVKGWPKKDNIPRFLLTIRIGHDNVQPPEAVEVNTDVLIPLGE